jgi:hypothetical protein
MLDPNPAQRATLQGLSGAVGVLMFLAPADEAGLPSYLAQSGAAVLAAGGRRHLNFSIDHVVAGEPAPYTWLTLDRYPDASGALQAIDASSAARSQDLSSAHALLVRLEPGVTPVSRLLSRLRPLWRLFSTIDETKAIDPERVLTPPRIHSTPAHLDDLRSRDPSTPFFNLNLTRYRDFAADQPEIQRRIYTPSARRLLAFGGYIAAVGDIVGTLIGSEDQPIFDEWEAFAIASWPSRTVFQTYLANVSADIADARKTYLARVIQLACSDPAAASRRGDVRRS